MVFGAFTTPEAILAAVEAQAAASTGVDPSYVFSTLFDDKELTEDPLGDSFVTIRPGVFASDQPWTRGGGRKTKKYDMSLKISLWLRSDLDAWKFDSDFLKDQTYGVLAKWLALLNGLEQFCPVNSDGICVLTEPLRNLRFEVISRTRLKGWGKVESDWSAQFLYSVTQ